MINRITSEGHVKFISYTGKYPNLCRGILTLEIDGTQYKFGYNPHNEHGLTNFPKFWSSGGQCGFRNGWQDAYTERDEWIINEADVPEQFRQYIAEIDDVFNSNVEYGCCGGCI